MTTIMEFMLWVRVFGYLVAVVAGFLLGILAMGRMMRTLNGRRRQLGILAMLAFGLSYVAAWGAMGVWQYGRISAPLNVPLDMISVAFSAGVAWLGFWLGVLVIIVLREEWRQSLAERRNARKDVMSHAS